MLQQNAAPIRQKQRACSQTTRGSKKAKNFALFMGKNRSY